MANSYNLSKRLAWIALFCAVTATCAAQQRDVAVAPVETASSSGSDNTQFEVAPGITLPAKGMVWILDPAADKPELVRIHLNGALDNRHAGENLARSSLKFVKLVRTLDLPGAAAQLRVKGSSPTIFVRKSELEEEELQSAVNGKTVQGHYVLLRVKVLEDRRELCSFSYWAYGGKRTRHEDEVDAVIEQVATGQWLKITPKQPLADGEYAVMRMPDDKSQADSFAYDFGVGQ